jgi:hypothetical protein
MVVDVAGQVVLTHDLETRHPTMSSDMDHPPADQVALGKRLANQVPNQLDFQADHVCSGIPRRKHPNLNQLSDFALTWPDPKDLMDDGGRCGRVNGLDTRPRDKTSNDVF